VRFSRGRARIGFEQRKCRRSRRGGSELLPAYIIWWRTRFRTSTRWRFLNLHSRNVLKQPGRRW
jgi:hypothetical protein